ncbi:MAG: TIGR03118 family protein [Chloroflexota bacterium]
MSPRLRFSTPFVVAALLVAAIALGASSPGASAATGYKQTNLVSDVAGQAPVTDPNLINAWGLVAGPTTPWWVSDNHSGFSTVYTGAGAPAPTTGPLVVAVTPPTGSPTGTIGAPTGIVFNGVATDFLLDGTNPARFIFSGEDGTISGWNSTTNAAASVVKVDNSANDAIYKGLAIGTSSGGSTLYATDFHNGKIDAFDKSFAAATLSGNFTDPNTTAGFAPFNIQAIGSQLYVTYAKQDADAEDDTAGVGNGYVDVFDMNGGFVKRLISQGKLNSPWGIAMAPATFGDFSGKLLVGNFGDGVINAYDPNSGAFVGALTNDSGSPIIIPGLWALAFGNGAAAGDTSALYFTAGPSGEDHGLFGNLTVPGAATAAPTNTPASLPQTGGTPTGGSDFPIGLLVLAIGGFIVFGSAVTLVRVRARR